MTTLADYLSDLQYRGVPITGDAQTQAVQCVNFARRHVWNKYRWPFKRIVDSLSLTADGSTKLYTVSTIGADVARITRMIVSDGTTATDVIKKPLDWLIDTDPGLDNTGTQPKYWADYDATQIIIMPSLTTDATFTSATVYSEKKITALANTTDNEADITDDDLVMAVKEIAYARAQSQNDDINMNPEFQKAERFLMSIVRLYEDTNADVMQTPGWNPTTGKIRKR